jgi:hypothetical protein
MATPRSSRPAARTVARAGANDRGAPPAADGRSTAEARRVSEDADRTRNWKRWGPYLAERQWGTVREDYSPDGAVWEHLTHDHARSRAYRWGEDGLLGICDRQGRLCFALALWNGRDPILKERLFGLTGNEGNHGEDVKEEYFYLDSTPTHSYMRALYKYPLGEFPYERLVAEARERGLDAGEFELQDSGAFDEDRYADVEIEYAKASPEDIGIRIRVSNRSRERARIHVLPTLWFRNTWSWGRGGEGYPARPRLWQLGPATVSAEHATLGRYRLECAPDPAGKLPELVFTENETNSERLWGVANAQPWTKDAFHDFVVGGRRERLHPGRSGTKAAAVYALELEPGGEAWLRLRLSEDDGGRAERPSAAFAPALDRLIAERRAEADQFYDSKMPAALDAAEQNVVRQAYAGLLWSKQFYHYVVDDWLQGDPAQPAPPDGRRHGRNRDWRHVYNRDVLSMPDKWEYPWFAAWDLAFHAIPFARIDPDFAKQQLLLLLREWYMHPNGQIPAYEFALSDVNPPVHAWAVWRVYKMTGPRGARDRQFLERAFQKLLLNFTWWVNRKDAEGNNLFSGGFLGLDNIGVFDRSRPLPGGGRLEQADGTAWMAFFCATMLSIALELAREDPVYEDIASKFFEHFVAIADAINHLGGAGLWNEADGFYYDQLLVGEHKTPLAVRSMVGLVPLFTAEVLEDDVIRSLPGFSRRMRWFLDNRRDLGGQIAYMLGGGTSGRSLLAIPSRERLARVLRYVLDENEFLSPHGLRSLSRVHRERPYVFVADGREHRVSYEPAESSSRLFGGNSNWRGPVWFPMNYLLVEALERYHHFYGDDFRVECPTGSGRWLALDQVASELYGRLARLFVPEVDGRRPCHGGRERFAADARWKDLVLFHEYFHGDTGAGLGASHQTGWTALAVRCIEHLGHLRLREAERRPARGGGAGRSAGQAAAARSR